MWCAAFWRPPQASDGERTWWAHLTFTRINIKLTLLKNQIEEQLEILAFK